MSAKTLVGEFHADHTQVVQALMDLRSAIRARDLARVRATLDAANKLVGPHFKFEELHLYQSLKEFTGEAGMYRLLMEHDGVFRGVAALLNLAARETWSEAEARAAEAYVELIWEHPITCDGLSLYIERLPAAVQTELLDRMEELRRQGTTLLEYRKERL
jgi:hypothetical protein